MTTKSITLKPEYSSLLHGLTGAHNTKRIQSNLKSPHNLATLTLFKSPSFICDSEQTLKSCGILHSQVQAAFLQCPTAQGNSPHSRREGWRHTARVVRLNAGLKPSRVNTELQHHVWHLQLIAESSGLQKMWGGLPSLLCCLQHSSLTLGSTPFYVCSFPRSTPYGSITLGVSTAIFQ